jgi:hypothetical protein
MGAVAAGPRLLRTGSALARSLGLGRQKAPVVEVQTAPPPAKRGRPRKLAVRSVLTAMIKLGDEYLAMLRLFLTLVAIATLLASPLSATAASHARDRPDVANRHVVRDMRAPKANESGLSSSLPSCRDGQK